MRSEEDRILSIRLSALRKTGTLLQVGAPTAFLLICAVGLLTGLYMRRSLKQREQSQMRLQLAMDAAHLGSWQYDPLHRVVCGDTRSKEIFDVAENEAPIEEIMERVNPDDAERVRAAFQAAFDPAEPKRSAEFQLRRGDGVVRCVETLGLAHFEGERGAAGVVGTVADITGRKQHEEREHLLMREVSHRAKNMLSVVDAIAHQTATRNPEDFIKRFSERIQALSANQELLVGGERKGVGTEGLVRAQLAPFADLVGSRIAVHGPKLRLKAAGAQAIGLALHELATNAGKYGALSTNRGRVDICWATDGDTFTMSWVERDGPPVSKPKRRGFGTIVMEVMTERSVDGKVDLDYAPSDVTWRLTCPAANALGANADTSVECRTFSWSPTLPQKDCRRSCAASFHRSTHQSMRCLTTRQCSKLASRRVLKHFAQCRDYARQPVGFGAIHSRWHMWPGSVKPGPRKVPRHSMPLERRIITAAARFASNPDPRPHPVNVSIDETWLAGFGDAGAAEIRRTIRNRRTVPSVGAFPPLRSPISSLRSQALRSDGFAIVG
jgi:PAS domain S-box-containing protein